MSKKILGNLCTNECNPKHIMSNLYACATHGEFYYWPKLENGDVIHLAKILKGNES
jgi:hypothetical protein